MWRRRLLGCPESKIKNIEDAIAGDICFYDKKNDTKIIVDKDNFYSCSLPLSDYTPIGIVAVPSSHTDEKRPRLISLDYVDIHYLYWGDDNIINGLQTNKSPYLIELTYDSEISWTTNTVTLPIDVKYGINSFINPLNSNEWFVDEGHEFMCSPYKEDDTKEEKYFTYSLADFDGKANTEKILAVDNSYSTDWQTADTINNVYNDKYTHPAAQACWRYYTDDTKQGDWYLPSMGEFGYVICKRKTINDSITLLNESYEQTLGVNNDNITTWTSTLYSSSSAYYGGSISGFFTEQSKNYLHAIRGFLKL